MQNLELPLLYLPANLKKAIRLLLKMVIIFCYLERNNYKVLTILFKTFLTLKKASPSFKHSPFISAALLNLKISKRWRHL